MIPLDDPRWKTLMGAYKRPYNASPALTRLERGENVWDELCEELHHQGDVGEASYAAVPHLVRIAQQQQRRDWESYTLISVIEVGRHKKSNPNVPNWLLPSYEQAIRDIGTLGLVELEGAQDELFIRSAIGAVALSKGLLKLGAFIALSDTSEIDEILEEQFSWS